MTAGGVLDAVVMMPVRTLRRALRGEFWRGAMVGAGAGYLAGMLHAAFLVARRSSGGGRGVGDVEQHEPFTDCGRADCKSCAPFRPN